MSSKEIITILSRLSIPVNNHMSVMEPHMVQAVEGFFSDVKARAAARTAAMQERKQERDPDRRPVARTTDASEGEGTITGHTTEGNATQTETGRPAEQAPERRAPSNRGADDGGAQITGARPSQPYSARTGSTHQRRPYGGGYRSDGAATQGGRNDRPFRERAPGSPEGDRTSQGDRARAGYSERSAGDGAERSPRPYEGAAGGTDRRPGQYPPRQGAPNRTNQGGGYNQRPASAGYERRPGQGAGDGNRPQSAGGRPQSAGGRPQSAGGRPQSAGGRPQSAGGRPQSAGGRPQSAGGRPQSAGGAGGPRGGYQGGGARSAQTASYGGAAPARSGDNRRGPQGGSRPARYSGESGGGFSSAPPRFEASPDAARSGQAGAQGQQRRRGGDRGGNSRSNLSDRRENNRKLQPPRSRSQGRTMVIRAPEGPKQVHVDAPMTVSEFAHYIRREASEVIKKLLFLGMPVTINQELDTDAMALVGAEFGTEVIVDAPRDLEAEEMLPEDIDVTTLEHRPPVVTIMGHVDHGKTTLLDAIRQTNVTASEAGGITQHIGAYQVEINQKKITFLDTPGHAAFTTMRARGAQVTDITVLVVAADDGVMPQTVEAINHAKAANVPIIVAINKMDKPGADPDRIKQALTEHGLVAEEWGGDTIFVPLSALQKQGIEELLEMILLVAEVADLKASLSMRARGTVVEAQLDKGRGPVATILVQNGTLRIGEVVVAGHTFGKVRAMVNDRGRRVKEAQPSMPVEIVGLSDVPSAGDLFVVYDDERQGRLVAERRSIRQRAEELGVTSRVTLDDLYKQIQEGEVKDLNLILKADVHGSAEAVLGALQKIEVSGVRIRVIHNGVGAITESDILLASASNAIVIGFNVRPEANAVKMGESEKVDIRLYRVIYNLIEEIEAALRGMLDPVYKEVVLGRAEVRQLFKVSKVGTIAGGMVQDGKLVRDADVRVIRGGVVVHEGKLDSLKRFKDDAREVSFGYECGFTLERFNDIKEGDIVEAFKMEAIKAE
ncbi:MAG: translation initiation factor IF-2 [Bacilli bacterium]